MRKNKNIYSLLTKQQYTIDTLLNQHKQIDLKQHSLVNLELFFNIMSMLDNLLFLQHIDNISPKKFNLMPIIRFNPLKLLFSDNKR